MEPSLTIWGLRDLRQRVSNQVWESETLPTCHPHRLRDSLCQSLSPGTDLLRGPAVPSQSRPSLQSAAMSLSSPPSGTALSPDAGLSVDPVLW